MLSGKHRFGLVVIWGDALETTWRRRTQKLALLNNRRTRTSTMVGGRLYGLHDQQLEDRFGAKLSVANERSGHPWRDPIELYDFTPLETNSGATYRVLVMIPGAAQMSREATLTVTRDLEPRLSSAFALGANAVQLLFSEALEPLSANNPLNLTLH
jgi:hypothetical protein